MKLIKPLFLASVASLGLTLGLFAQTPTPDAPTATPAIAASVSPVATMTPAPATTASNTATPVVSSSPNRFADEIKEHATRHFGKRKHGVTIDADEGHISSDGVPSFVPVVAVISILAVFGFPVAIVAVVLASSWAKTRSLHRTVRMMVEKGQPVPPELLASPAGAPLRPWWDLRRGIVLIAVGFGIMMFFGISAGWDVGVWALGLIPALIGVGYLLAWRLAYRDEKALKQ